MSAFGGKADIAQVNNVVLIPHTELRAHADSTFVGNGVYLLAAKSIWPESLDSTAPTFSENREGKSCDAVIPEDNGSQTGQFSPRD